jgi:general secretion pathway protein A
MYERFYNLRERPFSLTPDPDYLYRSRVHTEALNYLRYGIEGHAGFVVITGEIGSGKTTLLQTVMRGLDSRTCVARLMNTMLDGRELLEAIMLDFGLEPQPGQGKAHLVRDVARFLVEQRTAGKLPLLIIDEAQNLSHAALEEVRMLSNLETEKSKLIQIILVGQPNLHEVLARPELEQLRQRITVRYNLRALDQGETAAYINHRLHKAAIAAPLVFPTEVTDLIGEASHGVPRKINVIADAVLLFGYGEDKHVIDVALVREVIDELTASGVLVPAPAVPAASVPVPGAAEAAAAAATDRAAEVTRAASEAIAEAERRLAERENALKAREHELAEQRRVLIEQYRLLKQQMAQAATGAHAAWPPPAPTAAASSPRPATAAAVPATPPRSTTAVVPKTASPRPVTTAPVPKMLSPRPVTTATAAKIPAPRPATAEAVPSMFESYAPAPNPGIWRRLRRGLFGLSKPVFED